jgi:hypothetical protein
MRPQSRATAVLGALALLLPGAARAEDASPEPASLPIALELAGCTTLDQAELFKLLAVEFQTLNVQPQTPLERVRVACSAQRATVTLESSSTSNEVDLVATRPAAWPRLLALSVSEIVIESRARVAPPRATVLPALPVSRAPARSPSMPEQSAVARLFAGLALRRAVRPATWLTGPELGVELELSHHFSVGADMRAEFGSTDTDLAKVGWVSASGALIALVGGSVGRWGFGVGPGLRAGYLRLSPTVREPGATGHRVSGAWGGPELVLRARYDLGARWFAVGSVDSGIVTAPVTGLVNGQQRLVDTGGGWISLVLGGGVAF